LDGSVRVLTVRSARDLTSAIDTYSAARVAEVAALDIDGFVLKKDSPSCGLTRVKVYGDGGGAVRTGRGRFAQALCAALPLLPIEEEGRLRDPAIRENFVERIFAHRRLRGLLARPRDLLRFHTSHKLLLLAHSPPVYAQLGRVVAVRAAVIEGALAYGRAFAEALRVIATRGRHANVLRHAAGYLREILAAGARRDLALAIADYEKGLVPLVVPTRLVTHYVKVHGIEYLAGQTYFDPYPKELMLRNLL
jgi:uncharacterized protein YbgA (DUF1722 family)